MKPILCTNSDTVRNEVEAAQQSGETCAQVKENLTAEMNNTDGMITIPDAMKKSIIDLNNTLSEFFTCIF